MTTTSDDTVTTVPARLTTRLRLILAVVLLADVLDLMDSTITNIAAPTIVRDIGGGESLIKWLGASYALAAALRDVPADRFPHVAAIGATELMSGPGRLDWGFRVLINGVIHTPRPETETSP